MKKPIYNVVRYRNTNKCVYGENKKIANKKNNFVFQLINDEEDDTVYDPPTGFTDESYGEEYFTRPTNENIVRQLTATLLPSTAKQSVHFELSDELEGVTITPDGLLTITPAFNATSFTILISAVGYPDILEAIYWGVLGN